MHTKNIYTTGKKIDAAEKVLIMIHGRGSNPHDITSISQYLNVSDYAIIAPQATNNTWYPFSLLANPEQNEPWLSSAISVLKEIVDDLFKNGILSKNIYFLGFSQGASLGLEFVARNAMRYGGVVAFTGGLIGDKIYTENYSGDLKNTPIFIGSSNPDPYIPVERIKESTKVLQEMNADVTEKIYNQMGHTISQEEIDTANTIIFKINNF